MNDLSEFLRARLDEVADLAKAATPGPWWHNPRKLWMGPEAFERYERSKGEEFVGYGGPHPFTGCVASTGPADDRQSMADAAHIARHEPTRVLRNVESTRRAIGNHAADEKGHCRTCAHWTSDWVDGFKVERMAYEGVRAPCLTLRLLALPYADHPDYREDWRP